MCRVQLLLVAAIACVGGCGQPVSDVGGIVKFDGEPLAGVFVQFWPKQDMSRPCGSAVSDEAGAYCLKTHEKGSRWTTGTFVVRVIDPNVDPKDLYSDRIHPRFPWCYWDQDTTPLETEIHAGSNDLPVLELSSMAKLRGE